MSVARHIDGKMAAVTWWVDDVMMDEDGPDRRRRRWGRTSQRFTKQIQVMKIWDELIQNKDRNQRQPPVDQRLDACG